jgi:RNA polymerase sigma-70 factor, ECF subfamily
MDSQQEDRPLQRAIVAAKAGDVGALDYLYTRFADDVRGYVASIVVNRDDADDVTHDVFLKLTRVICRYEPRTVPFVAWLMRVARNAAIDHVRARRQVPMDDLRVDGPADDGRDGLRALRSALRRLPDDQRQVLVLRHLVGLTPGEIADRLHRTESSVHGLHHRGRRTLRGALVEEGFAPVTAAAAR